jgi:Uma2 family endonuclease
MKGTKGMTIVLPQLSSEQLFELCQINPELRIERTAQGEIIIMPPTGGETGNRNAVITTQLTIWSWEDDTGVSFDSSTGFDLPDGATRSPDAAWVRKSRLKDLSAEQKEKFLSLCPDFVVEIRSPSDSLRILKDKMEEYIANGAELGWLIDTKQQKVLIYRPDQPVEELDKPLQLSGDPLLPNFYLNLERVWEPSF